MTLVSALRIGTVLLALSPCVPRAAQGSDGEPSRTRHVSEIQIGGGVLSGISGLVGPMVHVQARFALWRTIGPGVYVGGSYLGSDGVRGVIPVCGRLNLSLPFWRSFEPVFSVGAGHYVYFVRSYGGTTTTDGNLGLHAALALLFPHKRHGFGLEGSLHVTGDPTSDDANGFGALVATVLLR